MFAGSEAGSTKAAVPSNSGAVAVGPPEPGADRQLVMFAWLHTALEPGREANVTLDASQLDQGHGVKPTFKKLKKRGVQMEVCFESAGPAISPTRQTPAKTMPACGTATAESLSAGAPHDTNEFRDAAV